LTDFGGLDPYVGVMKGVILGINPEATVVDLGHGVSAYGVLEAAFHLKVAYRYFPQGTIHVVVVDPGVGSARRPILCVAGGQAFLAPDNGVLGYVLAAEPAARVIHVAEEGYFLRPVSRTFHGRDVFAPVAAHLSLGLAPERLGPPIADYARLDLPRPRRAPDGRATGEVLHVDRFGNLITNLTRDEIDAVADRSPSGTVRVRLGTGADLGMHSHFASAREPGRAGALVGSSGHLEIFVYQGSAAETLGARVGSEISLWPEP
jgi:S-adenosylmethionine hydrolase